MLRNISKLIDVKTIVTLSLIGVTCYGFITDKVLAETFMPLVMAVIVYYFTKREKTE